MDLKNLITSILMDDGFNGLSEEVKNKCLMYLHTLPLFQNENRTNTSTGIYKMAATQTETLTEESEKETIFSAFQICFKNVENKFSNILNEYKEYMSSKEKTILELRNKLNASEELIKLYFSKNTDTENIIQPDTTDVYTIYKETCENLQVATEELEETKRKFNISKKNISDENSQGLQEQNKLLTTLVSTAVENEKKTNRILTNLREEVYMLKSKLVLQKQMVSNREETIAFLESSLAMKSREMKKLTDDGKNNRQILSSGSTTKTTTASPSTLIKEMSETADASSSVALVEEQSVSSFPPSQSQKDGFNVQNQYGQEMETSSCHIASTTVAGPSKELEPMIMTSGSNEPRSYYQDVRTRSQKRKGKADLATSCSCLKQVKVKTKIHKRVTSKGTNTVALLSQECTADTNITYETNDNNSEDIKLSV